MVAALASARETASPGLAVELRNVSHVYDLPSGPLPVLENIDLKIEPGSFVALLGPSGSGKSTLLRLVAGLEPPVAGSVLADGVAVEAPDPSRVLVFQDPTLFPWRTVRRNVALGLEAQGRLKTEGHRIDEAIGRVRLSEFADAFPHQLSGGMAQRAALARALVNDPRLLLLDEPLGKLDQLTRLTMQGELLALWQQSGFTALLVTHDVEEALLLADRIVIFSDRPARILGERRVERAHPRHRGDPELVALRREILALLGVSEAI
ncbi:ABC transporter ATP-binding protein [Kaistia sp. MMO-174]|uniref:ABC transporter ATP-binding protein n=1 Tax=Kaistia sp. MMO-174 TaxID=3081256 RepID=UPI001AD47774|nr:ABC transporter ATP-binding protein [Hyphomicrobiales bacterium]